MDLIACDGQWQQDQQGYIQCLGTLQNVEQVEPFLPALTYTDANLLLGAVGGIFALVWMIRQMGRVIR